jgi:pimeloyl-ACP methyl ester carboxylesterase
MPFTAIRGVDHYYEWISQSERLLSPDQPHPGKPVLVFVHGWAGSTRYWQSTAIALSDQFDCLLYDLRGFGQSRLPRPVSDEIATLGYELESYADDLALLLDRLQLQRVYLNAHSTGSSIAVLFMTRHPDRVERAVLTCHGIFEYQPRAFKAFHQFGRYVVLFRPPWLKQIPGVEQMFMSRFLRQSIPQQAKQDFLEDFLTADFEAALGTIYTAVSEKAALEMPQEYTKLIVPTLLISGQYDKIIPVELGQRAASLNSIVTHITIPKTAHFPMLEDPDTYLQQVRPFLQGTERAVC